MDTPCHKTLPPAGRFDAFVRFYGWAPDPDNGWKQRISEHIRPRRTDQGVSKTWLDLPDGVAFGDTLLDLWFDTDDEAADWVEAKNMRRFDEHHKDHPLTCPRPSAPPTTPSTICTIMRTARWSLSSASTNI